MLHHKQHKQVVQKAADNANPTAQQESNNKIKILDKKPKVEEIKKQNKPNRIITNINGNPSQKWVLVGIHQINLMTPKYGSQSLKTLKMPKHLMQTSKVDSKYLERDKQGNIILKILLKMMKVNQ